jgi:hypothetical protein
MGIAGTQRVLVFPDLHAPYHDSKVVKLGSRFKDDFKPHKTIALGDWVDAAGVSTYARYASSIDQLEEFEIANELLDILQPDVYLEGNHEHRFRRVGNVGGDIRRMLDPRRWLELDKRRIQWVPYSRFKGDLYRVGDVTFIHGFRHHQYASKSEAEVFGNVVHGHTHRIMRLPVGSAHEDVAGYNIGCMLDLEQKYTEQFPGAHTWQNGFAFLYIYKSGRFSFHQVEIRGERVTINAKTYRV